LRLGNGQTIRANKDAQMAAREHGLAVNEPLTSGVLGSNVWAKQHKIVTMRVSIKPGEGKAKAMPPKRYKRFSEE
jgi:hypothetical protein